MKGSHEEQARRPRTPGSRRRHRTRICEYASLTPTPPHPPPPLRCSASACARSCVRVHVCARIPGCLRFFRGNPSSAAPFPAKPLPCPAKPTQRQDYFNTEKHPGDRIQPSKQPVADTQSFVDPSQAFLLPVPPNHGGYYKLLLPCPRGARGAHARPPPALGPSPSPRFTSETLETHFGQIKRVSSQGDDSTSRYLLLRSCQRTPSRKVSLKERRKEIVLPSCSSSRSLDPVPPPMTRRNTPGKRLNASEFPCLPLPAAAGAQRGGAPSRPRRPRSPPAARAAPLRSEGDRSQPRGCGAPSLGHSLP
ncbi:WAS/WASL-interacting protein family member 1-like [Falco biarmicus]|uniref:WAS/WASL-interacting protein family member 1-like n=1 Tax=Falco biarmicus TaxID=345155 RepID=UPI0024BC329F|nr:WAS/WASL-interacting protein family member 1-like [Falco biarmicus]